MPVTDALHTKDLHHEIATYSGKELNLFFFHVLYFCRIFFVLFFMHVSVQVMVQISHFLSSIENDKRNQQQLQMYS